jgi:penicillin-binding protein 1A
MNVRSIKTAVSRTLQRLNADPAQPASVWMRARRTSLCALAVVVVATLMLDAWLATCGFAGCPSAERIRAYRPSEGGRILDTHGQLIGRVEPIRRVNVPLSDVPVYVRQAFVATEDRRFYEHDGVDARGVGRALVRNVLSLGVREGSSTITMQVARNTFLAGRFGSRSIARKLLEVRMARLLEHALPKDRILELYLNAIYLGNGVYGVEGASRDLFGKRARDLTLAEGATLAALPKAPSVYTPRRDAARAKDRRNLVLSLMAREGYISKRRAQDAAAQPLRVARTGWDRVTSVEPSAITAVRVVIDSILRNTRTGDVGPGDLVVYTTLDATAQRAADRAVQRRAAAIQRESNEWYHGQHDVVQGALVALDAASGEIRAIVGGTHFQRGDFNRALYARRQPGSAFKPFVYVAALEAGLTPATLVDDEPVEVREGGRVWTPANYGDEYSGRVTLRTALMKSANAAAVRVSRAVGEDRVIQAARDAGITSPLSPVPSIALGALEVTPIELATAYASFANGGVRVSPSLVHRIDRNDGATLWMAPPPPSRTRVLDPRDVFQLTSMLRSVVDEGTGRTVRDLGVTGPVAGKTGTTNDGTDVWFVGYSPSLVAAVWFGFDTPAAISGNAAGGRLAAPAWAEFYRSGWNDTTSDDAWAPPDGMVMRVIDSETGELATDWCPQQRVEWFKDGTEPTTYCSAHGFRDQLRWIGPLAEKIKQALKKIWP